MCCSWLEIENAIWVQHLVAAVHTKEISGRAVSGAIFFEKSEMGRVQRKLLDLYFGSRFVCSQTQERSTKAPSLKHFGSKIQYQRHNTVTYLFVARKNSYPQPVDVFLNHVNASPKSSTMLVLNVVPTHLSALIAINKSLLSSLNLYVDTTSFPLRNQPSWRNSQSPR
jgi:hypothetical protein